jgi:hypothetical protein
MLLALRVLYTAAVMVAVVALLKDGSALGGLIILPAAAVWLRREAESGRLAARFRGALRH